MGRRNGNWRLFHGVSLIYNEDGEVIAVREIMTKRYCNE